MVNYWKVECSYDPVKKYGQTEREWWLAANNLFSSPSTAENYITEHYSDPYSQSHAIYRVAPATWEDRERQMIKEEVYQQPLWKDEPWWQSSKITWQHYAHISLEDPTQIAFTASPQDGERDRQTRMKPGRYLARYFSDVLTPVQVAYYAQWWVEGHQPSLGLDIKFAATSQEIAQVYATARPGSCMDRSHFDDPSEHPSRVYGAGDLQLAWLPWDHDPTIAAARALTWPEKQVFFRVYPDPQGDNEGRLLRAELRSMGYKDIYEHNNGFEGARLLKIMRNGQYVMPYVDLSYGVNDDGEYWTLTRGDAEYSCDNTGGYLGDYEDEDDDEDMRTCEDCDDSYHVDDGSWYATQFHAGYYRGERSVCMDCRDANSFYCDGVDAHMANTLGSVHCEPYTFCEPYFEREGGYHCERLDRDFLPDDSPPITMSGDIEGETWSERAAEEYGFYSDWHDEWFKQGDVTLAAEAVAAYQGEPLVYPDHFLPSGYQEAVRQRAQAILDATRLMRIAA